MAIPYRYFGVLLTGGVLLLLSFHDFNRQAMSQVPSTAMIIETAVSAAAPLEWSCWRPSLNVDARGSPRRGSATPFSTSVGGFPWGWFY